MGSLMLLGVGKPGKSYSGDNRPRNILFANVNKSGLFSLTITTTGAVPYIIDWGDGNTDTWLSGQEAVHTYTSSATKNISLVTNEVLPFVLTITCSTSGTTGTFVSTGLTNLTAVNFTNNSFTSIDVSPSTPITSVITSSNTSLTTLNIGTAASLITFKINGCTSFASALDLSDLTSLTTVWTYNTAITSLDCSGCTSLTELYTYNCGSMTAFTMAGCNTSMDLRIDTCGLNATEVGDALIEADAFGTENGSFNFSGNVGSTWENLSADAQDSYAALVVKGWTMTYGPPDSFMTLTPAETLTVTFTVDTTDTNNILIDWGDDNVEWLTHQSAATHEYTAGSYNVRMYTPSRILKLVDGDTTLNMGTTINCTLLTAVTDLRLRKSGLTSITNMPTCLTTLEVDANALDASNLNAIILALHIAAQSNGTLDYDSQDGNTQKWTSISTASRNYQINMETSRLWTVTPPAPKIFWTTAPQTPNYLLIADTGNNRLKVHTTDGTFVKEITGFTSIAGILNKSGTIYVLDKGAVTLKVYNSSLVLQNTYDLSINFSYPNSISVGPYGSGLFIADDNPSGTSYLATTNDQGSPIVGASRNDKFTGCVCDSGSSYPYKTIGYSSGGEGGGIAFRDSNFYVSFNTLSAIMSYSGQFGLILDTSYTTHMYATTHNRIWKISNVGSVTKLAGNTDGSSGSGDDEFDTPKGITQSTSNYHLWIVDSGNNRIKCHNYSTGAFISEFGSSGSGNDNFSGATYICWVSGSQLTP